MEFGHTNEAMGFHEPSMEHSIGFVKSLQELKNLRSQLYSAAEYCEKSYLHSEKKQVVLDNIKDYAARAVVNTVDHIGTVAYKLTDVIDQQTSEISTTSLRVTCLHQQLRTCETYMDREGVRQQQLLAVAPRHHKHYSLPSSVSKKVHFGPQIQARPRLGTPPANTLCWHLASETKSTLKRNSSSMSVDGNKLSGGASMSPHASYGMDRMQIKSSEAHLKLSKMGPASSAAIQTLGIPRQDSWEGQNPMMSLRSLDSPKSEIPQAPKRSKSGLSLSSYFVKQKTSKRRTSAVS